MLTVLACLKQQGCLLGLEHSFVEAERVVVPASRLPSNRSMLYRRISQWAGTKAPPFRGISRSQSYSTLS